MKYTFSFCLFFFGLLLTSAQTYSEQELLQGYKKVNDKVTFLFSPKVYGKSPKKVVVTGMHRDWSQDMTDPAWILQPNGENWTLTVPNIDPQIIQPHMSFKFRIDDGEWLDPPASAINRKGTDLVFEPNVVVNTLKAELRDESTIWASFTGTRPLNKTAYRLTNAEGEELEIAAVLPNTASETLLKTALPLDKKRVYFLEIPQENLKSHCSFDGWFRTTYSSKSLGANIENEQTTVRLFAPRAEEVKLYLYTGKDDQKAFQTIEMKEDKDGVWEAFFEENLHGTYYDFTIHGAKDIGNHFYETMPVHFTDPYARVSDNTWGKARIWKASTPATPLKNGIPKLEDVIAYEVHVQDFTDQLPVSENIKGRLPAMTVSGLRNSNGEKIGFDYLKELGINVLHLMPVQEYLHFPDEDWKASFQDDEYMIEQGIAEENYQWGYRTSHCFAVESKYRTKGKEPGQERDEFRDLVQAFHDEDIAVIIDIVPNHTAENMVEQEQYFHFNAIDKQYYYRTKDFGHIGEYGNEVKTENRPMVQRWLIDQCKHWIEEFGIDGFRIDLAGQIDQQTLKALKKALGPEIIVYGEAWIGSNDPDYEANPDWDWYKEDSPITFFQDDSRNAYKGPVFELNNKETDRGWPGGKYDERGNVMKGLAAKFPTDKNPLSGVSYLDIHDNFALADQFGSIDFDGRLAVDQDLYKIATTLLYTTLGPIVTHGGSEVMRSKAHAPLREEVRTTNAGFKQYMHGKRDTYNHRTANQFIWEQVGQKPIGENQNDYQNMHAFWKGMNAFRMSEYGKVFRVADAVDENHYQFLTPEKESLLGYIVAEKVFVLLNAGSEKETFKNLILPKGKWKLIGNNKKIDHNGIRGKRLKGGKEMDLSVPAEGLRIWVRD